MAGLIRPLILITGATGAIGPCVVHALQQAEYQVRTFSVDVPVADVFPQSVEVLIGDITDKDAVQSAMQDVGAVVHMAALLHVVDPSSELREKYERVNVGGTATIVEAAINAGVKHVVLFSTISVYGSGGNRVFDEDSPCHPETYYAETKLAAEKIVLSAKTTDHKPIGTVLRLGAVYGSRMKGNYGRVVHALAHNRFIPIGDGLNRRTLVYDKDVAQAAVLAMEHPAAAGRVYNVTDGSFYTLNEIILGICKVLGRKPPWFSLPAVPVRFGVGILENGARLCGCRSPLTRATIDKYREDIAVESNRIQRELGFVPRYDLDTGWRETIQERLERGIL